MIKPLIPLIVVLVASLYIATLGAEEAKAPQLTPDVKLELLDLQNQTLRIALTERNLEAQYAAAQKQMDQTQAQLNSKLITALERSGLDAKKYTVDNQTFAVSAIPKPPAKK